MTNPYSPYSPSGHSGAYYPFSASPSPAASPSGHHGFFSHRPTMSPRHHARHTSYGDSYGQSPKAFSPRYNSAGFYATAANVSRNKTSWSAHHEQPKASSKRRNSYSYQRASYGESDEDDDAEVLYYTVNGALYRQTIQPVRRAAKTTHKHNGHGTDHYDYYQNYDRDYAPRYEQQHSRRNSASTPRPRTASRPTTASPKKPAPSPRATEADARRHRIPPGYSLKNWDPSEEPIMLLGSVFDANSLGKWVYDWTVYHHGPATPIAEMAGELWLLLIQLAGKVKRSEECMPRIRKPDSRELVEDFIESGERLTDRLRKLLKTCEVPMLKVSKKNGKDTQLGKNAGTEFVDSIFGRDRQLDQTERFMAATRLWNMRFDANCEDILHNPRA